MERLPRIEKTSTFLAYSGTTLENFTACATPTESGLIVFDKDKVPQHYFRPIFFVPSFMGAAKYAQMRALELNHSPLVFAGEIPSKYKRNYELPENMTFPVRKVWVPKNSIDWRSVNHFIEEEVDSTYAEIDPILVL